MLLDERVGGFVYGGHWTVRNRKNLKTYILSVVCRVYIVYKVKIAYELNIKSTR